MRKYSVLTVLVLLAFMAFAVNINAQAAGLTANDVKFHENWTDNYKPVKGAFAAKWYNGRQPQVMCYNQSSRSDLPNAMLQEILDYLSANRPQTAADMADANFAYKQFETAEARTVAKATQVVAQPKVMLAAAPALPVQPKDDSAAKNLAELNALKNELAAAQAAEIKRLKDAKPAPVPDKAKAPAPAKKVAKSVPTSPCDKELAACKGKVGVLETAKTAAENALGQCNNSLGQWQQAHKEKEAALKTANGKLATAETAYGNKQLELSQANNALAKAQEDGSIFSLGSILRLLLALVVGAAICAIVMSRSRRP